jgi:hypothetical protein
MLCAGLMEIQFSRLAIHDLEIVLAEQPALSTLVAGRFSRALHLVSVLVSAGLELRISHVA